MTTTEIPAPEPGIYENVPFADYCAWPCVNNSSLGPLRKSPAHYLVAQETQTEPSDALRFGTFAHAGKLEPLAVINHYVVLPEFEHEIRKPDGSEYTNVKATKAYKDRVAEFHRINANKEVVPQDWYDKLLGICEALSRNRRAAEWFGARGPAEVSIVWDDPLTGLRCKARIDKLDRDARRITDLKTTVDASQFGVAMHKYGYARQAGFYADGMRVLTGDDYSFALVAVEKEPPFGVRAAEVDFDTLNIGRCEYRRALRQLVECRRSSHWPSYTDPDTWQLPSWSVPEVELTVSGELISVK